MVISNIWITDEYQEKVSLLFEKLNVFDVDNFFQKHRFENYDKQTEENTNDHDINIVDEITYDTFIAHLGNYFPELKKED